MDPTQRERAAEVIRREFASETVGQGTGLAEVDVDAMTVHSATYDFPTLLAWRFALKDVLNLPDVHWLDADERNNRIAIGVADPDLAPAVVAFVASQGVPREAVLLKRSGPLQFRAKLTDGYRPQGGGLKIRWETAAVQGFCTLGFSASRFNGTDSLFVTNAHCSPQVGNVDNTLYYQPTTAIGAATGIEIEDYPWQTSFTYPECPPGSECKVADALLARYRNASSSSNFWTRGRIYRTTQQSVDSIVLTIDDNNPYFTITSTQSFPFVGDAVHKVGQATGWTSGGVTESCVNTVFPDGASRVLLCQDYATYVDSVGDSGAPVFKRSGSANAVLVGIHWGLVTVAGVSKRVFSAYGQIEEELNLLRVTP